jgi:type VI secretion system secreted protein VgrG
MNPKSGNAGSPVSPTDPAKAEDADVADPGEVEKVKAAQRQTKSGKYGSVQTKAAASSQGSAEKEAKKSWIEILAVDEKDRPLGGERYRILLPDGSVSEGTLDEKGLARIDGIEPGTCTVTFPDVDKSMCKKS